MAEDRLVVGEVDPRAWEDACRRDDVVRALLASAGTGPIGRRHVAAAAEALDVSIATLYRMIARFRETRRASSLLAKPRGRPTGYKQIHPDVEELIRAEIRAFYLKPERPSLNELVRQIAAKARSAGMTPPMLPTIKRRVEEIGGKRRARARQDHTALEAMAAVPGSNAATRPLEIVQIDHTLTDVVVVDEATRAVIGRPWLTLAIDVFSRMVCGFYLSFDPPSRSSVGLCLLHAVFDKTAWLASLGIDIAWPTAGLPASVHVDNASEFRAASFERACREFGIRLEFRPVWAKHYGGHIERLIGTAMGAIQILPGTTHGDPERRQGYDAEGRAVLTMKELETWLALEIAGKYHQQIHKSLDRPPIAVWREWEEQIPLRLPDDRLSFWVSFLPEEARTLQRDGIHLHNIRYWSGALAADIGRTQVKLAVKYDPRDLSRVFVRRPNGHWVEARYRDLKRPAVTLWEYRAALRKLKEVGRREVNEEIIFRTILAQRDLVAKASATSAAARLAKVRSAPVADLSTAPPLTAPQQRLTGIDLRSPSGCKEAG